MTRYMFLTNKVEKDVITRLHILQYSSKLKFYSKSLPFLSRLKVDEINLRLR